MNASVALQHFCDLHSAQILLCTEARTYVRDSFDNDEDDMHNDTLNVFYSQYIKSEIPTGKIECKSCTLSPDGVLVSTIDPVNHLLFISSASTPNKELFKDTRNACVRSLTIEKPPDTDYPVLFGDDENGYCLSLAFSCKDFYARGSQRLYSLCYLCRDKFHLVSIMPFITECMKQVVYWLQTDANGTFEQEGRIKCDTSKYGNGSTTAVPTFVTRTPPRTPTPRMLSDIVRDPKLTYRIHALFVWLLRTGSSTISEALFDALPTEEQTTKQERKDVFDNDTTTSPFSQSMSKRRTNTVITAPSSVLLPTLTNNISYLATSFYSNVESSRHDENGLDEDDFDSLQYQFSSYGNEALKLFEQFVQKLNNPKHLQYILYNLVIGNQIIVKYTNRTDNIDLIRALASVFRLFLPDGCCHLIETTNHVPSCTANLILFDTDTVPRSETLSTDVVNGDNNSIVIKIILDDIDDTLRVAKLETLPPLRPDFLVPTYVKTIIELLADTTLDNEAFETIITRQKIKYLNKAKLYFQLGRCQNVSSSSLFDENQQINLLNIKDNSDLLLVRFWQKGLSQTYKKQIRMLIRDDNQQQSKIQQQQQQK